MNNMIHSSTRWTLKIVKTWTKAGQGMPTTHVVWTVKSALAFVTDLEL